MSDTNDGGSTNVTEIHAIPLGFDTCYVLKADGVVVIDAGQPNKGRHFSRGLAQASIRPDSVGLILLTHAHWDHMGSAAEIRAITGAPLAVHEAEATWVEHGKPPLPPGITPWGKVFMSIHRLFMPLIRVPACPVDRRMPDEAVRLEEFGIPGVAVPTPGHSPGSISIVLETGEAFVGDLAMNRPPLTLRPRLSILGDAPEVVTRSWARILELGATRIFPAHGPPFDADVIEL